MKFVKGCMLLGLISLIAVSVHPSLSYAEQTQGSAPILVPSAADTVVRTDEAGPFMLAHWRPALPRRRICATVQSLVLRSALLPQSLSFSSLLVEWISLGMPLQI